MKIRRRYNKTPSRRKVPGVGADNQLARRTPAIPTFGILSGGVVPVTFDVPVTFTGDALNWLADNNATGVVVTEVSPTSWTISFAGLSPATEVAIPFESPMFRTMAGGYVQPGTYVFDT